MSQAMLEHVNFTVTDPKATAKMLCDIFGWSIRWEGEALNNGYTVHVGSDSSYLAVYSRGVHDTPQNSYKTRAGLNHIGIVVDDLDAAETKIKSLGFETHSHADYEPGRRFYFYDADEIEFEVICYD